MWHRYPENGLGGGWELTLYYLCSDTFVGREGVTHGVKQARPETVGFCSTNVYHGQYTQCR